MSSIENVEIRIVFTCNSTNPNEKAKLVGSLPILGNWIPSKGIDLLTDPTSYPEWTATIFLPARSTVEYKYVIVKSDTGELVRWESLGIISN